MSEKKSIYKPKPVSGFPEWLPDVRMVEQQWLDHIRRIFESYGYCSIETPAVEELNVIQAKGGDGGADVDKEVYVIERLHKEENDKEARLALHFDQTVPLARYVAQHFNDLTFPFKRYQMQKVWRGERPQAGRFREFYQCDIDVINVDNLPLHFDAEMPAIMWEILNGLPGMANEKIQIRVNNRKLLIGLLHALCADKAQIPDLIRLIDKKDKIPEPVVQKELVEKFAMSEPLSKVFFALFGQSQFTLAELEDLKKSQLFASKDPNSLTEGGQLIQTGMEELSFVLNSLSHLPWHAVVADLSVVRGLDYYTGTVYETVFTEDPSYGSICSGGRYDDLAGNYINKHLPGVGISIGFSRLFDRLRQQNKLPQGRHSPAQILVLLLDESQRAAAAAKAKHLRDAGFNVEMFHSDAKIQKQFGYAEKKGIPFVFVPMEGGLWEVKDMAGRTQKSEAEGIADIRKALA
jgi:histidyl-tRNA synthetase